LPIRPEVSNLASERACRSLKIINNTLSTFSSRILEETVSEFSRLPGIGKRTALRLVLHLLKGSQEDSERLGEALVKLHKDIKYCTICHNITEQNICEVCSDQKRDKQVLCIVEDIRDVITIENTQQFSGQYHILGGIISPMDGVGPNDLNIPTLLERIRNGVITEVIIALPATLEGDTTAFFIFKKINQIERPEIKFSTIARGISVGGDLEFADEVTLGRSILQRVPYENSLMK